MRLPPPTLIHQQRQTRKQRSLRLFAVWSGAVCAAVILLVVGWWLVLGPPNAVSVTPQAQTSDVAWETAIAVTFTKPVNRRSLAPTIAPDVPGMWVYESPLIKGRLFRTVRFLPEHVLDPATTYTVTLAGVTDALALGAPRQYTLTFTTASLPDITTMTPSSGARALSPTTSFSATLTNPVSSAVVFAAVSEPEASFHVTPSADGTVLTLTPDAPLRQGTAYTLAVTRVFLAREYLGQEVVEQSDPVEIYRGTFTTAEPPNLVAAEPAGDHVRVGSPIVLTFSQAMDAASVKDRFSVSPATAGSFAWSADGTVLTYTPSTSLAYDTEYTVTIPAGTATKASGFLERDTVQKFRTIGPVRVSGTVPADGATGIVVAGDIHIQFDQAVDPQSAETRFQIEPAVAGTFSLEGTTLHFKPSSAFAYSTRYRVTIAAGVAASDGLPSIGPSTLTFTTAPETVELDIAIDLQDHSLSCEAAALKMALSYYGIKVSEGDIMTQVGFDGTPHIGNTWGDPYTAFVGNINGRQNTTGYGVYWGPIARAANGWRPAESTTGMTTEALASEIAAGHPVVVWGVYGNGYRDDWQTPSGKSILAWKGEHTRTVIGFIGSVDAPKKIILNDPYAGKLYWTREQFERNWSTFGNAAVIVR